MKLRFIIFILFIFLLAATAHSQTAKLINELASKALDKDNYVDENGIIELYGIRTNGTDTKNGELACAKVVTIILLNAGVVDQVLLGVRHVEAALEGWGKVENKKDLKNGDVIVWINRFKGRKDKKCTGGGNCHVGIVTENGYFHNSPISDAPTFNGISLWAFKFKIGYRPPD
jgi:hypothetical protein